MQLRNMLNGKWLTVTGLSLVIAPLSFSHAVAQSSISDELQENVYCASGMNYSLTATSSYSDTPPPAGKKPFYINHYGSPSAFYLEQHERYDAPYRTLSRADSLGKLTPLGRDVLRKVTLLHHTAHRLTGELTEAGKRQARESIQQLGQRFPEMFTDETLVDGRSIVQRNCLLTLDESMVQVSRLHHPMRFSSHASYRHQSWMNPQDEVLENQRKDSLTRLDYARFIAHWPTDDARLVGQLFNDADYAWNMDATALSQQLFDVAGFMQFIDADDTDLYHLFTADDIHRHWLRRNAWAYLNYGGCLLSGGHQHYSQRKPLVNLLHMGDSIAMLDKPVIHLRYTRQSVVMSLACLLELDGYGVQTASLDSLEALGWADYRIAPLGGSVMIVHYRSDKNDPDPLIRVLLNGREARLPIQSDCAPYYHWKDVKRYYLRKLYVYARDRNE